MNLDARGKGNHITVGEYSKDYSFSVAKGSPLRNTSVPHRTAPPRPRPRPGSARRASARARVWHACLLIQLHKQCTNGPLFKLNKNLLNYQYGIIMFSLYIK